MSRKIALAIMLVAILIVGMAPVTAQEPPKFEVVKTFEPSSAVSTVDKGIIGAPEGFDPSEVEVLSVIVTFKESVDANALAAVSGGTVIHRYSKVFHGASLILSGDKVRAVAAMPGVTGVYYDELLQLDTDRSPYFLGAQTFWHQGETGEGVVVGVLDTGIWPEHPSFSDPDMVGVPYPPPPGGPYECDFGDTAWNPDDAPFTCNNKLIGAYEFRDTYKVLSGLLPGEFDSARDANGHGTHTSSTAAGNHGVAAELLGVERGYVAGIAPRAHVIMYSVCGEDGCWSSDSAAAVDQAILDGVDVINFSISGGNNPYSDAVSQAFMSAYENGVFVACSAGNDGPGADTTDHREPWTTTVGASTSDRHFISTITLTDPYGPDELVVQGASVTDGIDTPTPVVLAADYGDALCLTPFPGGTFSGEIVVCERGTIARVLKSFNVAAGGAGGLILYNPELQGLSTDSHFIPSVHVEYDVGQQILTFFNNHPGGVEGQFTPGEATKVQGDVMASFSSRGGPGQTLGISKPDVTAPGVQILAGQSPLSVYEGAGVPGEMFQAIQGTSMSSPHVAGAGALVAAQHPTWTPGQIKSALMMTAINNKVFKEDAVTKGDAFDYGSGRINLAEAGDPGLTIDESAADYVMYEYDLWNANYPSLFHPNMPGQLTVQRTVADVTGAGGTWTVQIRRDQHDWKLGVPGPVVVPAGGEATFDITIDARLVPQGEVRFGEILLLNGNHRLHIPVTFVRGMPGVTIDKVCDPDSIPLYGRTACTITIENAGYEDANVQVVDRVRKPLKIDPVTVVGATQTDQRTLEFNGFLAGAGAPVIQIDETFLGGYVSLAGLGATPFDLPSNPDEGGWGISDLDFYYLGDHYTNAIWSINGTVEAGQASGYATGWQNTILPTNDLINNLLAPWWTDLDLTSSGNWYLAGLTDGVNNYTVFEWEDVPRYGDPGSTATFQIWILDGTDMIWFTYGGFTGDTTDGTVGAEDATGTIGDTYYFDGAGTLPAVGTDLQVSQISGVGDSHTIYFEADGLVIGAWTNCAEMTADTFAGVATACSSGEVTPP